MKIYIRVIHLIFKFVQHIGRPKKEYSLLSDSVTGKIFTEVVEFIWVLQNVYEII